MENPIKNTAGENGGTAGTKLERLQLRARRLQQQAQQARERLREEESAQEKLAQAPGAPADRERTASARWAGLHRRSRQFPDAEYRPDDLDIPTARCRSADRRDATAVRATRGSG